MAVNIENQVPLAVAAQKLRVTRTRAYDYVLSGRLAGSLHKGRWYVDRDSLAMYIGDEAYDADPERA